MHKQKYKKVIYNDSFQKNYVYFLTEPKGKNFHKDFKPQLIPAEMLKIGIFGGAYFIGVADLIPRDLPKSWFKGIRISNDHEKHKELNFFMMKASLPLSVWRKNGWIYKEDPHGWFQWYCRYYMGRRCPDDLRQIKRWKAFNRHYMAVVKNCKTRDLSCRPRQRQALLHWAYDSLNI